MMDLTGGSSRDVEKIIAETLELFEGAPALGKSFQTNASRNASDLKTSVALPENHTATIYPFPKRDNQ